MIAKVIVDITSSQVDKVFDYFFGEQLNVKIGDRVRVSFGRTYVDGYVLALAEKSDFESEKLKPILSVYKDNLNLTPKNIELISFMSKKYNLRLVDCIRLFLPPSFVKGKAKPKYIKYAVLQDVDLQVIENNTKKNAKNQLAFIEYLRNEKRVELSYANSKFGASTVKKFLEQNIVKIEQELTDRLKITDYKNTQKITLTSSQQNAIFAINNTQKYQKFLLFGVTGSGKTEVYMNVIQNALNNGKKAIMLVPEISLTPQMIRVFVERFGQQIAVLHSGLSIGERFDQWQKVKNGEVRIVIGARSAIFAPIDEVGVIIIDEEHDSSYLSESNPRYDTRQVASKLAMLYNIPLVFGSATPSIETFNDATKTSAAITLLELPNRINNKSMPPIQIVDMTNEIRMGNTSIFSRPMSNNLQKCFESGNQAMLFINRRGYNSFVRCFDCGYVPKCEYCDVSLVYHKYDDELKCHFCNRRYHTMNSCPMCGSKNFKYGAVGTQRVVDELKKNYPLVKVFRLDNDVTTKKDAFNKILTEFANTRPAVLVGTQMIAKGHDFPYVSLVGIVDADMSLYLNDYRSTERTFNLVTQVSGRAGRKDTNGVVVLQTYSPKHYVYNMAINYDYKGFFEKELNIRKATKFPPFCQIVRILISSDDEKKTIDYTSKLLEKIKKIRDNNKESFIYLDAMKSPVKRINNKYRFQILMRLKDDTYDDIINQVFNVVNGVFDKNISCFIEQNPQNLS